MQPLGESLHLILGDLDAEHRAEERQEVGAVVVTGRREHARERRVAEFFMSTSTWKKVVFGTQRMPFGISRQRRFGSPSQSGAWMMRPGPKRATPSL